MALTSTSLADFGLDGAEHTKAAQLMAALPAATPSQAVRFLRARKGDAAAATEFLQQHLAWREIALPVAFEEARAECDRLKYTPLANSADGRLPDGRFVLCIRARLMGKHTYQNIREVERGITYIFEYLEQHVLAPLEKVAVVLSRAGASPDNFDPNWIKTVGALLQNNYPERLLQCHVAPVPLIFRGVWETVKWFLDPVTRQKVALHGSIEAFADVAPPALLPRELGGEREDDFTIQSWLPAADTTSAIRLPQSVICEIEAPAPAPESASA